MNFHASKGEIAGNISENNKYGSKFPDASRLWIHSNRFRNNDRWGLYMYNTLDEETRVAGNSVIYLNEFSNNGNYPLRVHAPAHNVLAIDNLYSNNELNDLRIVDAQFFICPNSTESEMTIAEERPVQIAVPTQCDLANVADLFPLSLVYLPLSQ